MSQNQVITVRGIPVGITQRNAQDYLSLTDIVKGFDGGSALIEQWLKNKDTVHFLSVWEQLNNPEFESRNISLMRFQTNRCPSAARYVYSSRVYAHVCYYLSDRPIPFCLVRRRQQSLVSYPSPDALVKGSFRWQKPRP